MARARNIKPGFFRNDKLAELDPYARLLFIGLWTVADKAGRLHDRSKRIKADIFPYEMVDVEKLLVDLDREGFIQRYGNEVDNFIQVINWDKHQNPHIKEAESEIPAFCMEFTPDLHGACTRITNISTDISECSPADSLIPDSLILDSLIQAANVPKVKTTKIETFNPDPYIKKFNETCVDLSKVQKVTDDRKKKLKEILKEHGDDIYDQVLEKVKQSDFLSGRNESDNSWCATFDWIITPKHFIRILEGCYDKKPKNFKPNNKFHNFEQSMGKLTESELDEIARKKEERQKARMIK